ncbi:hypothetical protein BDC45DRAFT_562188 [Circinella umbellata]|nr:hypothetical protein BDC45DRAFT_562188 [Circinella umbellata]
MENRLPFDKKTRSIDSGIRYLYQVYPTYFNDKPVFVLLKVLDTILTGMSYQGHLLEKRTAVDVTEYEYLGNQKLDDDEKIMNDRAEVNRGSKDDLDCVLDLCEDDEWTSPAENAFTNLNWYRGVEMSRKNGIVIGCGRTIYYYRRDFPLTLRPIQNMAFNLPARVGITKTSHMTKENLVLKIKVCYH